MKVTIILGISAVLMLFIFLLVAHHHDVPERVNKNRGALLTIGASMAERINPVGWIDVPSAPVLPPVRRT